MATKLVTEQQAAVQAKLAQLTAELAELKQSLEGFVPEEPVGLGSVVRFQKYNRTYTYAAIKVGDEWYLTQNPNRPQDRKFPKTWSELLTFIGERNLDTIEVLS